MSKGSRECTRGPLAPYVPGFRDELSQFGYSKSAAKRQLQLMARLSAWLEDENLEVFELATPRVGRFFQARPRRALRQPAHAESGRAPRRVSAASERDG